MEVPHTRAGGGRGGDKPQTPRSKAARKTKQQGKQQSRQSKKNSSRCHCVSVKRVWARVCIQRVRVESLCPPLSVWAGWKITRMGPMSHKSLLLRQVGAQMPCENGHVVEGHVAAVHRAPVVTLVMHPDVPRVVGPLRKRALAPGERARVRFFSSVDAHVGRQHRPGCEPLATAWMGARKRPFALKSNNNINHQQTIEGADVSIKIKKTVETRPHPHPHTRASITHTPTHPTRAATNVPCGCACE